MCTFQLPNKNIKVKVVDIKGKCRYFQQIDAEYDLEQMLPCGLCLKAFHTIYPYYLTFLHGGWFHWTRHHDLVIAQCADPFNSLVMEIRLKGKEKTKSIIVKIIGQKGSCQKGYSVGDAFEIDSENTLHFCPRAFDALYPHYLTLSSIKAEEQSEPLDSSVLVDCPSQLNTVVFKLYCDEIASRK